MAAGIDIEKVKREGLEVDLERYIREGYYAVKKDDFYRLKMHGLCTQRHEGFFMLRMRVPGGRLDPDQMEKVASLAADHASGMVHLTTRQNIELHSVRLENVPAIFGGLKEVGITTRSACGHTFRNVLASPCAGTCPGEIVDVRPWVEAVSKIVVAHSGHDNPRLPKRLNVSFNGCDTCDTFALVNDIGFTAARGEAGEPGFSLHVGGSMGITPKLGYLLRAFLPLSDVIPSLRAVTHLYIQHGDRESPAKGRLKFLIEAWGLGKFQEEFERILPEMRGPEPGLPENLVPVAWPEFSPIGGSELDSVPEGVAPQRQKGFYRVSLFVPLGEIHHDHFMKLARWARTGCSGRVLITKEQNLEFQWVPGKRVAELWRLAEGMGLMTFGVKSILDIQACPGTSFCSLAITSSQGAAQGLLDYFRGRKALSDPSLRHLRVHISGCPNSCSSHQGADIGFSGAQTKVGEDTRFAYQLFLGGRGEGMGVEIGTMAKKGVADEMVVPVTDALITVYQRDRLEKEIFRDFLKRLTTSEVVRRLDALLVERGLNPVTYNRVAVAPWEPVAVIPGG